MAEGRQLTEEKVERTLELINDEITQQDQTLLDFARGIDTKATFLAGFAVTAISFLLGHRRGSLWVVSIVVLGVGFVLALAALWPRRWNGLKPSTLVRRYSSVSPLVALGRVIRVKEEIYERNHRLARAKTWLWVSSVAMLGLGGVLMIASVFSESSRR